MKAKCLLRRTRLPGNTGTTFALEAALRLTDRVFAFIETRPKETSAICLGAASFLAYFPMGLPSILQGAALAGLVASGVQAGLDAIDSAGRSARRPEDPKRQVAGRTPDP
jgi:hypothetical protein